MELQELELLEAKITLALKRIESLKEENSLLRDKYDQLQRECNEKVAVFEEKTQELEEALDKARDPRKEEAIRRKVSDLLEKLENIQA